MPRDWLPILSGERRDPWARLLRGALTLGVPLYAAAERVRRWSYDRQLRSISRVEVPVISIGNLTTGGVGKTPLVAWMVEQLQLAGATPGILSRGYRSLDGQANDEKLLLDLLCPGTPHMQNPDRIAGAREAISRHRCDTLVLDDGFQHRRLGRDLDIVLIDALNPWGYGCLLPRGLLREPAAALRRAQWVCLTRIDQVDDATIAALRTEVRRWSAAPLTEIAFRPLGLVNARGERQPLDRLHQAAIGACCGIGNPASFLRALTALGAPPTADRFRAFPDHHPYTATDRAELADWVQRTGVELLVVTQKDLVKLPVTHLGRAELWALEIGVKFQAGGAELRDRLRAIGTTAASATRPAPSAG